MHLAASFVRFFDIHIVNEKMDFPLDVLLQERMVFRHSFKFFIGGCAVGDRKRLGSNPARASDKVSPYLQF